MSIEPTLQATSCPECGVPAEVSGRHVLESTDGPVEHARVRCVGGHLFNLPVAMLEPERPDQRARRWASSPTIIATTVTR